MRNEKRKRRKKKGSDSTRRQTLDPNHAWSSRCIRILRRQTLPISLLLHAYLSFLEIPQSASKYASGAAADSPPHVRKTRNIFVG